jgi:hypothetical protein
MSSTIVLIILGAIFLALVIWDVYLLFDKIPNNMISQALGWLGGRSVLLPSALGYLLGHWFWRHPVGTISPLRSKVSLLGITPAYMVALLLVDIFLTPVLPLWAPAAIAAANIVIGHFCFPMEVGTRPVIVSKLLTMLARKKV